MPLSASGRPAWLLWRRAGLQALARCPALLDIGESSAGITGRPRVLHSARPQLSRRPRAARGPRATMQLTQEQIDRFERDGEGQRSLDAALLGPPPLATSRPAACCRPIALLPAPPPFLQPPGFLVLEDFASPEEVAALKARGEELVSPPAGRQQALAAAAAAAGCLPGRHLPLPAAPCRPPAGGRVRPQEHQRVLHQGPGSQDRQLLPRLRLRHRVGRAGGWAGGWRVGAGQDAACCPGQPPPH